MLGCVFDIKEFSVHDGPGVRTTVFLKGCPLRCKWCHNPEGLDPRPQIMVKDSRCVHCGKCFLPCTHDICKKFGRCIYACPDSLISVSGKEWDSAELAEKLLKGADFMKMSGGGVTISGGEPLLQHEFTADLLKRLSGVHRAIQTCGYATPEAFTSVIENVDLVMMDIKLADPGLHRRYTGVDNTPILENFKLLRDSGKEYVIRIPLIPDITDTEENLRAISEIVGDSTVELMPYNIMAGAKYKSVGLEYPLQDHKRENNQIDISIFRKGRLL